VVGPRLMVGSRRRCEIDTVRFALKFKRSLSVMPEPKHLKSMVFDPFKMTCQKTILLLPFS
jgi:hypothetical protein